MDASCIYEICVEGCLAGDWSDWFDGLELRSEHHGETVITGRMEDQAALFGLLIKLHDLNLVLISVNRLSFQQAEQQTMS